MDNRMTGFLRSWFDWLTTNGGGQAIHEQRKDGSSQLNKSKLDYKLNKQSVLDGKHLWIIE